MPFNHIQSFTFSFFIVNENHLSIYQFHDLNLMQFDLEIVD